MIGSVYRTNSKSKQILFLLSGNSISTCFPKSNNIFTYLFELIAKGVYREPREDKPQDIDLILCILAEDFDFFMLWY